MAENSLFEAGGVSVTDKRLIVPGGDTYAIAQISSIKTRMSQPSRKGPLVLIGLGVCMFIFGLDEGGLLGVVMGLAAGLGGAYWFTRIKPVYHIIMSFAGSETEALSSVDAVLIENVVNAVNRAIVDR